MEVFAVTMMKRVGALALAAGLALSAFGPAAMAQDAPAKPAAKVEPAKPAAKAEPAKPAAKKVETAKPAKPAKAASPCKGLDEAACGKMGETCSWIAATKRKDGKEVKAYCRKKGGFLTKTKPAAKPVAKPAAATTPAEPAAKTTAKKTVAPAAPAAAAEPAKPAAKKAAKPPAPAN